MQLPVPSKTIRQHRNPMLFAIMFADQYGARLELESIIGPQIGSPVPGREVLGHPVNKTLMSW